MLLGDLVWADLGNERLLDFFTVGVRANPALVLVTTLVSCSVGFSRFGAH